MTLDSDSKVLFLSGQDSNSPRLPQKIASIIEPFIAHHAGR